jgi:hypothetical protein
MPVTTYRPATTYTTYSPVVTTVPVATSYYTPVVVGPRYVPGEPVRNLIRAVVQ